MFDRFRNRREDQESGQDARQKLGLEEGKARIAKVQEDYYEQRSQIESPMLNERGEYIRPDDGDECGEHAQSYHQICDLGEYANEDMYDVIREMHPRGSHPEAVLLRRDPASYHSIDTQADYDFVHRLDRHEKLSNEIPDYESREIEIERQDAQRQVEEGEKQVDEGQSRLSALSADQHQDQPEEAAEPPEPGEKLDENGYAAEGYDEEGFDRFGYNERGMDNRGVDDTGVEQNESGWLASERDFFRGQAERNPAEEPYALTPEELKEQRVYGKVHHEQTDVRRVSEEIAAERPEYQDADQDEQAKHVDGIGQGVVGVFDYRHPEEAAQLREQREQREQRAEGQAHGPDPRGQEAEEAAERGEDPPRSAQQAEQPRSSLADKAGVTSKDLDAARDRQRENEEEDEHGHGH